MGRETVKAILQDEELLLTAVVDTKARGETSAILLVLRDYQ